MMSSTKIKNIVFDLGGVLIDWNPRYLYQRIFASNDEVEHFLATVCTLEWNDSLDDGRQFSAGIEELVKKFPHYKGQIHAYDHSWEAMLRGPIQESVEILEHLHKNSPYSLFALSNWSQDKFPIAEKKFKFLSLFRDIIVSGRIGMKKPEPRIFEHLCNKHSLLPKETIFIDDSIRNIIAANSLGFNTIHFTSPAQLREQLSLNE